MSYSSAWLFFFAKRQIRFISFSLCWKKIYFFLIILKKEINVKISFEKSSFRSPQSQQNTTGILFHVPRSKTKLMKHNSQKHLFDGLIKMKSPISLPYLILTLEFFNYTFLLHPNNSKFVFSVLKWVLKCFEIELVGGRLGWLGKAAG